jgi:hypothetical protein
MVISNQREGDQVDYRKAITELIGKIHSDQILKRIYNFVQYLYSHEADG